VHGSRPKFSLSLDAVLVRSSRLGLGLKLAGTFLVCMEFIGYVVESRALVNSMRSAEVLKGLVFVFYLSLRSIHPFRYAELPLF